MEEESESGVQAQGKVSWLHLVDLMISFDKRIKSLVEQSGILVSLQEDGNLEKISSLSVFCDRPDWLDLWAEIEVTEMLEKLKEEMDKLIDIPLICKLIDNLLLRCLEAEGLTALTDDDALIKVTSSINVAHYIESVLKEWSEDVLFLEMASSGHIEAGVFDQEIEKLEEFRKEWVDL